MRDKLHRWTPKTYMDLASVLMADPPVGCRMTGVIARDMMVQLGYPSLSLNTVQWHKTKLSKMCQAMAENRDKVLECDLMYNNAMTCILGVGNVRFSESELRTLIECGESMRQSSSGPPLPQQKPSPLSELTEMVKRLQERVEYLVEEKKEGGKKRQKLECV